MEDTYFYELKEKMSGRARFTETSLNRINQHAINGMIIISTSKSAIDNESIGRDYKKWVQENNRIPRDETEKRFCRERNAFCDSELYRWLKSKDNPYLFLPVYGGYKSKDEVTDNYEPSFIVFCEKSGKDSNKEVSWEDLYSKALGWCKKYSQDSVYIQPPEEPPFYVNSDGKKVSSRSSLNTRFNRFNEPYFTTSKRSKVNSKRFTSDISFDENLSFRELDECKCFRTRSIAGDYPSKVRKISTGELWNIF